jgi:hypothetical protein
MGRLKMSDKCLLQQAQISKMDRANKHDLSWLNDWLHHKDGGNDFLALAGHEFEAYDFLEPQEIQDLVAITSRASNDGFTRWLEEWVLPHLPEILLKIWRVRNFTFAPKVFAHTPQ